VRIGVNALLLSGRPGYRQTGLHRYVANLLAHLPEADADVEWLAFVARGAPPAAGFRRVAFPAPADWPAVRIGWEMAALPLLARRHRLDLMHGTMNVISPGVGRPTVVTVHDLAFLTFPETVTRRRYQYLKWATGRSVRSAARVLTVSEATKRDVIARFGIPAERVDVTPLGVESRFRPAAPDDMDRLVRRLGLRLPFVLSVGTLEPRKNLPTLLRAFKRIATEVPHTLVVAGAEGWKSEGVKRALEEVKLGDRLTFTGFLPDADLPALYSAAEAFAFPSLYEGFGLPVLEAMACGTPVLTAADSSLPEVAGDAALLVDPRDDEAIAEGLRSLLTDSALRASLSSAGIARAVGFTWQRTAECTVAAYRRAVG
jgi:glycosyltransferase involved in cell wall biosynthesis